MKKICIITSSPRKNGNSDVLAEQFRIGAEESGNKTVTINVRDLELKFCAGCMRCQSVGRCFMNDKMTEICDEVQSSDVLVFATPVYYYSMSGQLKTFLDRLNPLYVRDNRFKEVYVLATAADSDESAMDGVVKGVEGWIACFDGVELKGVIRGTGVEKPGEIVGSTAYIAAYETGKAV